MEYITNEDIHGKYTNESLMVGLRNHIIINDVPDNFNSDPTSISAPMQSVAAGATLSLSKILSNVNFICMKHQYNNKSAWYRVRGANVAGYADSPRGKCTYGPSTWYYSAGMDLTFWEDYKTATISTTKLPKYGFVPVWQGGVEDSKTKMQSMVKPGDICTMYVKKGSGGGSSHACMWTGHDWRSDFIQNNAWVYGASQPRDNMVLWRYPKISA